MHGPDHLCTTWVIEPELNFVNNKIQSNCTIVRSLIIISPRFFFFYRTCTNSPQGNLMLAAAILLFLALLIFLFLFDFGADLKPGVMTKVKTLLSHFQVSCYKLDIGGSFDGQPHKLSDAIYTSNKAFRQEYYAEILYLSLYGCVSPWKLILFDPILERAILRNWEEKAKATSNFTSLPIQTSVILRSLSTGKSQWDSRQYTLVQLFQGRP